MLKEPHLSVLLLLLLVCVCACVRSSICLFFLCLFVFVCVDFLSAILCFAPVSVPNVYCCSFVRASH